MSALVSWVVYGPLPYAQAAPHRAASLIASGTGMSAASAYASAAAKLSPAPYASAGVSGSSSCTKEGLFQRPLSPSRSHVPPARPDVFTYRVGVGPNDPASDISA